MTYRRSATALILIAWLGVVSSGSGGWPISDRDPVSGIAGDQIGRPGSGSDLGRVSTRVRGLGFNIGPIEREGEIYLVPVTGFRPREKAFRLEGDFRPFTLKAKVEKREIVLDKAGLDAAGFVVADESALKALGVRVAPIGEDVPAAQPTRPAAVVRRSGAETARQKERPAVAAGPRKIGAVRWSPLAMAPADPARKNHPPALGQAVGIQVPEKAVAFKSSLLKVNSRAPLAYSEIPLLDPGKKEPTPLADPRQALPALPNGQTLTAEDYYRELNLLERDFNVLGYSLDVKRDAAEETVLQEIPPPSGMNGIRIKPDLATLERVRSRPEVYRNALSAKQAKFAALVKPTGKTPERAPAEAVEKRTAGTRQQATRAQLQKTGPLSLQDALAEKKVALKPPPNPYKKEVRPVIVEKGDRDTFAIVLDAGSRQEGSSDALRVVNDIGVRAYIFGNGLDCLRIMGATYAPTAGGTMSAELSFLVLGNAVPGAGFLETHPVPAAGLAESAGLPPVGKKGDWSTSFDYSYGMSFMAGPIPLSVRVGARATLGLGCILLANPLRVENEIRPYANASVYAQAGVSVLIAGAGVRCTLMLMDTSLAVHGMLQRGAEEGREFLDIEYFVNRHYNALSGDLSFYAYVYVPAWDWPPWRRRTYTTVICDWDGWSDDLWEPAVTRRQHNLFVYKATDLVRGYNY
jgi:hypothetical protein